MLILVATERLCRAFPRTGSAEKAHAAQEEKGHATVSPLDPAIVGASEGTRYQLLRALRAMAKGEAMLVEYRIPSLAEHFDDSGRRESWFRSLRPAASWEDLPHIEPILVPGTAFPALIGRILIRAGWCAPSDTPHWVPNLRFFYLTDIGLRSLKSAQAWWLGLSPLQRIRLIFAE